MRDEKTRNIFGEEVYVDEKYLHQDNPWAHWDNMPHFDPDDVPADNCYLELTIEFTSDKARQDFSDAIDQNITERTKSIWFPEIEKTEYTTTKFFDNGTFLPENHPRYPIYIPSKGRHETRLTSDRLIEQGVKHYMIVEESQYDDYKSHVDPEWVTLLILPQKYLDEYDTCDDLGSTRSKGPGAARNFAWDHSISLGAKRHWVMDDNFESLHRMDDNKRYRCESPAMWRAMEDHSDRYENIAISGPHYRFLCLPRKNRPPFKQNTRIYSCLLIRNDIPYRWRGRYNEDTDLSLRVLKDGLCTVQYNVFLVGKVETQSLKGGNTDEFYAKEGTLPKSQMIADLHPDCAEVKWLNNRWHHYVNYERFVGNRLIRDESFDYINPDNEYGMVLEERTDGTEK